VCFHKASTHRGDDWPTRVAYAVNASRVYVPIYSGDSFSKPVCTHEIEQALKKHVMLENLIVPLMRSPEPISAPNAYDGINSSDATREPEFAQSLVERVSQAIAEVERRAVVKRARDAHPCKQVPSMAGPRMASRAYPKWIPGLLAQPRLHMTGRELARDRHPVPQLNL
jgi:hypothetical protein